MRWVLFAALGFVVIPRAGVRPAEEVREAEQRQIVAARGFAAPQAARQILFGDLHVHTTISFDAFMQSLPIAGGEGAHPPQDACDFARHCAALDFWSINDHAANILPSDWQNTVEGIRRCNAVAGDPQNPDTVAFLGWEWTQMGRTPETHYGHKNVVLGHAEEGRIPRRPIAARLGGSAAHPPSVWTRGAATPRSAGPPLARPPPAPTRSRRACPTTASRSPRRPKCSSASSTSGDTTPS